MKKKLTLEEEKKRCNEEWDRYLAQEKYDKQEMIFCMQKMNNMDYRLIENKRPDLLG